MKKTFFMILFFTIFLNADFKRDNEKQVVLDSSNYLMWQDDKNVTIVKKNWVDSIQYCENLNLGGYEDWRLPNINELKSILDETRKDISIDVAFQNVYPYLYISSTTMHGNSEEVWFVSFNIGTFNISYRNKVYFNYIRCVRDFKGNNQPNL